jgi:hypothetical protein
MKLMREQDIDKTKRIIGPGPFFCSFCGKQLIEGGHMMEKFFLCPDAGEFTWSPPHLVRVEVDGASYVVAGKELTDKELAQQRMYYQMCADAHERSNEFRAIEVAEASETFDALKTANDRRADRAGL